MSTSPSKSSDILIIGGGVIGMASAMELSRRGAQVRVIDKGDMGYGCSYGNAGWLTPCFAMPLPMPGMFLKSIGWLMDPKSPLYIKPSPSPLLMGWLLRFMAAMNQKQMLRSVRALTEISKYSLEEFEKLSGELPISFEKKGLLMAAQSKGGLKYAAHEMELVAPYGVPGKLMSADELRAFEPSITGPIEGGVFFPEEAHAEPLEVVQAMMQIAVRHGAQMMPKTEFLEFELGPQGVQGVRTTQGILKADQIVLATGAWSTRLAAQLGLNIPILGGKGYSMRIAPLSPAPQRPLMLVEKKVAVTPHAKGLKIAGTLELVDNDHSITQSRVDAIIQGAREFMSIPDPLEYHDLWRGLRPCTPDGVPVIGRSKKYSNLILATGHQMLGLQSAPGTGRLVGDIALGATPAFDPEPFRVDRF
jgi:D-amino-acid dehydrogenase